MRKDDIAWLIVGAMVGMALMTLAYDVFFGARTISDWLDRWGIGITAVAVLAGSTFGALITGKMMMASVAEDHRLVARRDRENREARAENLRYYLDTLFKMRLDQLETAMRAIVARGYAPAAIDLGPIFFDWEALGLISREEALAVERANEALSDALFLCGGNSANFVEVVRRQNENGETTYDELCEKLEAERLVIRAHRQHRQGTAEMNGGGTISASGQKGK
ncbi:hypothetical protein [Oceanibacterium hippocampi]|uniref:Uncharacterized protein n=1 Tax=Oceanibacterium hippocampi TaxID=745714 RepID=A0A1Y5U595_9PROT|nr:hypothetical protein [Oceanibacterium hippocampi]SLN77491.1 hypothetical protein OCH7691_04436 [Oceanibacterium hippocampi]